MARYLVEAHVLEGRSVGELAAAHGVHRSWIYKLLARYRDGGYEALGPRSRRPRSCKHETPAEVIEAIVALRRQLQADGHDAGAATIAYHLAKRMDGVPSRATIWRILKREGLIVPEPQKRPRSSLIRFQA
jgi:transposase